MSGLGGPAPPLKKGATATRRRRRDGDGMGGPGSRPAEDGERACQRVACWEACWEARWETCCRLPCPQPFPRTGCRMPRRPISRWRPGSKRQHGMPAFGGGGGIAGRAPGGAIGLPIPTTKSSAACSAAPRSRPAALGRDNGGRAHTPEHTVVRPQLCYLPAAVSIRQRQRERRKTRECHIGERTSHSGAGRCARSSTHRQVPHQVALTHSSQKSHAEPHPYTKAKQVK